MGSSLFCQVYYCLLAHIYMQIHVLVIVLYRASGQLYQTCIMHCIYISCFPFNDTICISQIIKHIGLMDMSIQSPYISLKYIPSYLPKLNYHVNSVSICLLCGLEEPKSSQISYKRRVLTWRHMIIQMSLEPTNEYTRDQVYLSWNVELISDFQFSYVSLDSQRSCIQS